MSMHSAISRIRRSRLDLNTSAELAIRNAMKEVEGMQPHTKYTDAVVLLQQAFDKVADVTDVEIYDQVIKTI